MKYKYLVLIILIVSIIGMIGCSNKKIEISPDGAKFNIDYKWSKRNRSIYLCIVN